MSNPNLHFQQIRDRDRDAYLGLALLFVIVGVMQWNVVWHPSWAYRKGQENGATEAVYGLFEVCSSPSKQCRKFTDHTLDNCVGYWSGEIKDGFRCTQWKITRVVAEMNWGFVLLLCFGSILVSFLRHEYLEGWRIFQMYILATRKSS
ncbi:hypothetical protein EDD11_007101 [Mortierella claussenii]|nr:hypothetical protein EDD11_007101 [Mortierella claussenii]